MGKPTLGPIPAENLRRLREHQGITLRELGDATRINHANLSKMERGKLGIGLVSARKLATYFKVPESKLWTS